MPVSMTWYAGFGNGPQSRSGRILFGTRMPRSCCVAGVAVEVVAHLLGHSSIATTGDTYAHLKVEDARRALVAAGGWPIRMNRGERRGAGRRTRADAGRAPEYGGASGFRAAVLVPAVGDPILGSPACAVPRCALQPIRRAVSGAPGPLETGRSPGPAGVGADRGSRGDGSSTASTLPGG